MRSALSFFKYLLPLAADAGQALLIATAVGVIFGEPFSLALIGWSLAFAYILDLDSISFALRHGSLSVDGADHRDGWHYPLPWLLGFVVVFLYFGVNVWTLSAFGSVFLHFLNDLYGTGWGVKVLWPFSNKSYKIAADLERDAAFSTTHPVMHYTPDQRADAMRQYGNPNWIDDIYVHPGTLAYIEYTIFALGVCAVVGWYLVSG